MFITIIKLKLKTQIIFYSTHFKYNIFLNMLYSKHNRVRRHALRHLVSLSYMPLKDYIQEICSIPERMLSVPTALYIFVWSNALDTYLSRSSSVPVFLVIVSNLE